MISRRGGSGARAREAAVRRHLPSGVMATPHGQFPAATLVGLFGDSVEAHPCPSTVRRVARTSFDSWSRRIPTLRESRLLAAPPAERDCDAGAAGMPTRTVRYQRGDCMPDQDRSRRLPAPWLRSVDEGSSVSSSSLTVIQAIIVLVVIAAVVAFAAWFLLLATGGPGPGTV